MVGQVIGFIMRLECVGMEGGWGMIWQDSSGHFFTLLAIVMMEGHLGTCEWSTYVGWHR